MGDLAGVDIESASQARIALEGSLPAKIGERSNIQGNVALVNANVEVRGTAPGVCWQRSSE